MNAAAAGLRYRSTALRTAPRRESTNYLRSAYVERTAAERIRSERRIARTNEKSARGMNAAALRECASAAKTDGTCDTRRKRSGGKCVTTCPSASQSDF